jgi:hypothetical protein
MALMGKNSGQIRFNPLIGQTCCYRVGGVGLHLVTHLTHGRLAGLSWAVLRFASERAGRLRLGRAGLRQSGGKGSGCWVGLDFRPGFGPQPVLYLKFLFFFQIFL